MARSPLVLGLAAVFAGVTVLLAVLALVFRELLVFLIALPFAAATYLFWYHATGRLQARASRTQSRRGAPGGDGPRRSGRGRATAGEPDGSDRSRGRRVPGGNTGPTAAEARRVLGIEAGADEETVRRAYRQKVKDVHPDVETGSEEAFKTVQAAYRRLTK